MEPTPRTARTTGLLYLLIILLAGFAEGFVRSGLVVPGDAGATAAAISGSPGLWRLALAADLAAFGLDAAVAVLLYVLLRPVSPTLSLLAAAFRLVAHPAIGGLNLVNHWVALRVLGDGGAPSLGGPEAARLAVLAVEAHGVGYLVAGAFFGVHCLILGHLLFRAGWVPRLLGGLVGLAGIGYLAESFGTLLVPAWGDLLVWAVAIPAVAGEGGLALYLLVKGSPAAGPSQPAPAAGGAADVPAGRRS